MVELRGLTKSYNRGQVKAVDDLDLSVRGGEIFGFLGPNGAGKTTTIKMMVGLLKPDRGTVNIAGYDIASSPLEVKRRISYVPDNPDVYHRLTGMEYLNFMGDVYRVSAEERERRILRLLDVFALGGAVSDPIKSYSHGMRQKIVLVGALLHDPLVFILDEPMVGLDPRSAHHLKEIMREHCSLGKTVFFSTHILEVAEKLCDRIGIINKGRLIALGTMDELRAQAQDKQSLEKIFLELTE
ncbi:MAG: ABC transporter ATP-binding protein [Bacillota bacterium]